MPLRLHLFFSRRSVAVAAHLLIIGAATLSGTSCRSGSDTTEPTPVLSGPPGTTFPMPPTNLNSLTETGWVLMDENVPEGEVPRGRIADYKGKVLVLDLYATWCAPCRESIPRLIALQDRYGKKGLQVIGLNVGGADDRVKVAAFAKEFRIQYPLGFPDLALTDLLLSDDASIPQTFIFSKEGKLVKRFIGYDSSMETSLEEVIKRELDLR